MRNRLTFGFARWQYRRAMRTRSPWRAAVVAVAAITLGAPRGASATPCHGKRWLGVWAASPSDSAAGAFVDQTLRLVVNPTHRGSRVRVKLSNRFGSQPVTFGAVAIARRAAGAGAVAHSTRALLFGGQPSVTVAPGGEVVTDERAVRVRAFEDLVVSVHVTASGQSTEHFTAIQTSYVSPPGSGDHTADEAGTAFTQTLGSWPYLTDVEVRASRRIAGLVALGDSITDGYPGPVDGNGRYPDLLARRLADAHGLRFAVQNAGISGNRVLGDGFLPLFGPKLVDRLDLDAIDQAGASVVILMEGTNDLGFPPAPTAAEVIAGLQSTVDRLHLAGFRVILGTQTPSKDTPFFEHGTPAAIAARNEINDWIRTAGVADGVVDFHAALRDPGDPDQLRPEFDSGDHLHPSAAGYQAMADAVDLGLLADPPCR
jgi:lysophospholipase L1-like esterase